MLTEKDYCDLDTSHELWVMGLEPEAYYDGPLILLYEAQKWLREEKGCFVGLIPHNNLWEVAVLDIITESCLWAKMTALSYEEALSEGIKEAVKILKENETIHE